MNAMKVFSWFNKPQLDLENEMMQTRNTLKAQQVQYAELTGRNLQLQQRVDYLQGVVDDINARESSIQSFAVDFKLLNAFCVERQFDDKGTAYTTIGWLDKDGKSKEWHLACNQDAHEALVKQFIAVKFHK